VSGESQSYTQPVQRGTYCGQLCREFRQHRCRSILHVSQNPLSNNSSNTSRHKRAPSITSKYFVLLTNTPCGRAVTWPEISTGLAPTTSDLADRRARSRGCWLPLSIWEKSIDLLYSFHSNHVDRILRARDARSFKRETWRSRRVESENLGSSLIRTTKPGSCTC